MSTRLEVLFTPAEFAALAGRDLSQTNCVVFDIFRATSTIVTALANGAEEIIPVAEIRDALAIRRERAEVLLAGERDGLRIRADLTGGIDFDLGNSPREFVANKIHEKSIVISTTNGSRALRAAAHAQGIFIGSFLNLRATAALLERNLSPRTLLICSGTGEEAAYEDILGAGAMADLLSPHVSDWTDSANAALEVYRQHALNLSDAVKFSRNGRRLSAMADLRDDVPFCLQRDIFSLVAKLQKGAIKKVA